MGKHIFLLFILNISTFTCKDIFWLCFSSFSTLSIIKKSKLSNIIYPAFIAETDKSPHINKLQEEKEYVYDNSSFLINLFQQYQEKDVQLQIIFYHLLFNHQQEDFMQQYYYSYSSDVHNIKDYMQRIILLDVIKKYLEILYFLEKNSNRYMVKKEILTFYSQQFLVAKLEIFHSIDRNITNSEDINNDLINNIKDIDTQILHIYNTYINNYIKRAYWIGIWLTVLCALCTITLLILFIYYSRQEINTALLIPFILMIIINTLASCGLYKIRKNKKNIEEFIHQKMEIKMPLTSKKEKEEYLIEEEISNSWRYHYSKNYLSSLWEYYFCPCSEKLQEYIPNIININYFHQERIRNSIYEYAKGNNNIPIMMQTEYENFMKYKKDENFTNQMYQLRVEYIVEENITQKYTNNVSKYYNYNINTPIYLPEHHYNFTLGLCYYKYFIDLKNNTQDNEEFIDYINSIFEGLNKTYCSNVIDKNTNINTLRIIYIHMCNHYKKDKIFIYVTIFAIFTLCATCSCVGFFFLSDRIIILSIISGIVLWLLFLCIYIAYKIFNKLNDTLKTMEKEIEHISLSITTENSKSNDNSFEFEKI